MMMNNDEHNNERVALRKQLRQRRNALDAASQERAAENLVERLAVLPAFLSSQRVALYLANDGEIDPAGVLRLGLAQGKRCYVPIVMGARQTALQFAEITASTILQNNRFGIAEPVVNENELFAADELDLVLVPLVGFDADGNRIGMGGGFYDTTFAFKKHQPQSLPRLIGLAHEVQRVEHIHAERWDIPIAEVVTDQRVYRCS